MLPLDARKSQILQAIVQDYVFTAEPVGSDRLLAQYSFGCRAATIRNEMAEMAELGYLLQPHTSAGRIPSDRGYRYYVDTLMEMPTTLPASEARRAQASFQRAQSDMGEILLQTCRILTELTSYPSLATDPAANATTLRRAYLTAAGPRHILLVMLLSSGHVEHRLMEIVPAPDDSVLIALANYLNARVADKGLEEIGKGIAGQELPAELTAHAAPLAKIQAALKQAARSLSEKRVFLEGRSQILRQPEYKDVRRLELLLNALEQQSALYRVLSSALLTGEEIVIIGAENDFEPMQECSVVTTSYFIGTRAAGYLGVVGPTRMDYARVTAAVRLMARNLSQMLTHLCPA